MKKLILSVCLIILLVALSANSAIALKCGNDLIREEDTTWKVETTLKNNGGKIIGRNSVGMHTTSGVYTSHSGRQYVSNSGIIEKWFVSVPSGYGKPYCYELTFIGSILKEIGSGAECK